MGEDGEDGEDGQKCQDGSEWRVNGQLGNRGGSLWSSDGHVLEGAAPAEGPLHGLVGYSWSPSGMHGERRKRPPSPF
jgi:hypothetical protein